MDELSASLGSSIFLCWDGMREPVPCRAMWVLSFPPRWLPTNPHLGGGGNVSADGIS